MAKGIKGKEVTDPDILAQLNSDATASEPDISSKVDNALSNLPIDKRELVMAQLRHENGASDLSSHVAIADNNVSGITWSNKYPESWKGTSRPESEGGHYVHFPTIDRWAQDHLALLHKDAGAGAPIDATTVDEYAHRLKRNGYYTAPEHEYAAGMHKWRDKYGAKLAPVTDPAILAQLNSEDASVEKKSPDVSGSGLANSSVAGPDGSLASGQPSNAAGVVHNMDGTQSPIQLSSQDVANTVFGKDIQGAPVVDLSAKPSPPIPISPQQKTDNASKVLISDITDNLSNLPEAYSENIKGIPFNQPGSIVNDVSDPHGDPKATGGYLQSRMATLELEYKQKKQQVHDELLNNPNSTVTPGAVDAEYFQKKQQIQRLKEAANHIMDLQLANKAAQSQSFDPIKIGIEKQKALGDKNAAKAEMDLNGGKPLSVDDKFHYQAIGLAALQSGKEAAAANGQEGVAGVIGSHSDNPEERLEKDNPEYFKKERIQAIANEIYKTENPVHGALFSRESISQDELEAAAKRIGLSKKEIANITPEDIPRTAGPLNQALQGFTNTVGAPLYEGGMRALAGLGIANKEAVDEHFHPGWEEENGAGSFFTGKTPQAQAELSIHNLRGIWGAMSKGVGDLAGFLVAGEAGGGLLQKIGGVETAAAAKKANTIANFATAAIPSYNSAYEKSASIIGDKPKDEWKRVLYSTLNGVIGGSMMLVDPQADIARDIIGETAAGKSFVNQIKDGGIEQLTKPEIQNKFTQIVSETAKHMGLQVAMPAASAMGENLTNMIFDPKGNHKIEDNVGQAALSGAIGMFIPSLMAGIHHPSNQSTLNQSVAWEVGKNPRKYRDQLQEMRKSGEITHDEFHTAYDAVTTMSHIINNEVPYESVANGKVLTTDQQQKYGWNMLVEHQIDNQLAGIPENEKTQRGILEKKKRELDAQRQEILSKAGDLPGYVRPGSFDYNQGEEVERSVATEAKPEEEAPAQKKSEPEENNNIPLNPDNKEVVTSLQKPEENGKEHDGHEVNNVQADNSRQEINPESRQNDDDKGQEDRQDGQLKPAESTEEKEATPQEQPLPVSGKSRRKGRWKETTEEEIPHNVKSEWAAWDLGKEEGKPADEASERIKATPSDQKIGGGESFVEFKDRIKKAYENFKGTAEDQTLLIAHSGVMKMLESAKEHGWDDTEALREAYNKKEEPPVGEMLHEPIDKGEAIITRHGESDDNADNLLRTKEAELTDKGEDQAKTEIADKLKEEGITPSAIESSDLPRGEHTAEIVKGELGKDDALSKENEGVLPSVEAETEADTDVANTDGNELPNPAPNDERSVATVPKSEQQPPTPKEPSKEDLHKLALKKIDDNIIQQKASQKHELKKRIEAEREGDIAAINKHNENYHKKQDKIDKLEKEREREVSNRNREQYEEETRERYNDLADNIVSRYEKNKENHKGIASATFLGLSHKIGDHIADFIVARVAEGVRELGNLHIAIHRAIELAKEKFGSEAKALSYQDIKTIKEQAGIDEKPQDREPVLSINNEELAKDAIADIRAGRLTHDEIEQEISEEEGLRPKTKAAILNYIDWHTRDQETHNDQTLREPKYASNYLSNHSLLESDVLSKYISGETLEDIHSKDVHFDIESKQAQLQTNLIKDQASMIGKAKFHSGSDDVLVYGTDMLGKIKNLPDGRDGQSVKKLLAITALNNELHGERIRLENALTTATAKEKFDIWNRLKQLDKMNAQAEIMYRDITSNASDILNAARANRLYRNTYFSDLYTDKILDESTRNKKDDVQAAMDKTDVTEKQAKPRTKTEKEATDIVQAVQEEKEKSEAGKKVEADIKNPNKKEPAAENKGGKEKGKSFVKRIRDKIKREKLESGRKEVLDKKMAEKKANDYLAGSTIEDLFKKAKEQTKKPC